MMRKRWDIMKIITIMRTNGNDLHIKTRPNVIDRIISVLVINLLKG